MWSSNASHHAGLIVVCLAPGNVPEPVVKKFLAPLDQTILNG